MEEAPTDIAAEKHSAVADSVAVKVSVAAVDPAAVKVSAAADTDGVSHPCTTSQPTAAGTHSSSRFLCT
jgi:hypothetical protein